MFRSIKLFFAILQIGGYILMNYANPVTNANSEIFYFYCYQFFNFTFIIIILNFY